MLIDTYRWVQFSTELFVSTLDNIINDVLNLKNPLLIATTPKSIQQLLEMRFNAFNSTAFDYE